MSKKKVERKNIGEIMVKLSVDKEQLNIDLDEIIKKLKKIKKLFFVLDLGKKAKDLLSYLKPGKKINININNSIKGDRKYIQDKIVPEIIEGLNKAMERAKI